MHCYTQCRGVVQKCRGCRREDANGAQRDQRTVEAQNKPVILCDPALQGCGDFSQRYQFLQIFCREGNIRNLPGNGCTALNGNACVCGRQGRRIID